MQVKTYFLGEEELLEIFGDGAKDKSVVELEPKLSRKDKGGEAKVLDRTWISWQGGCCEEKHDQEDTNHEHKVV